MQTSNAVAPIKPMDRFKQELSMREGHLRSLLPQAMTVDKFQAIVVAAVADNMDLLDCDRGSLLKACLSAAELGLSLNKNMAEADILKVWNGKTKRNEAQFRPRYKGLMKLALQSGDVLKIESRLVHANDTFEVEEGIEPRIIHKHGLANRGEMVGAYCVWKLKNGETQFEIMNKEQILAIRDRSSAKTKDGNIVGPWKTDEAEMWRKTVVRRASKYMPLSTEAQRAVMADNEADGIVDVDDFTGEVDDITDVAPEPAPAQRQVSSLEQRVTRKAAPQPEPEPVELDMLYPTEDADGDPDWDTWAYSALEVVNQLSPQDRATWRDMHSEMIGEAEMLAARSLAPLMKLFN
jgi:recombination protein RecT